MTVTTEIYVNWPTAKFATIPLIAFVQCVYLRGVVRFHAPPEPCGRWSVTFVDQPVSRFNIKMVVGSRKYETKEAVRQSADLEVLMPGTRVGIRFTHSSPR